MTADQHSERPDGKQPYDLVTLREFFTLWLNKLEVSVNERFKASDEAVKAALAAQKELTATAFASSEKAIVKAEEAQREYNIRSNEFRGQLDDQNKLQMARTEALSMFAATDKRIDERDKAVDLRLSSLETYRHQNEGKGSGFASSWGILLGAIGGVGLLISIYLNLLK